MKWVRQKFSAYQHYTNGKRVHFLLSTEKPMALASKQTMEA